MFVVFKLKTNTTNVVISKSITHFNSRTMPCYTQTCPLFGTVNTYVFDHEDYSVTHTAVSIDGTIIISSRNVCLNDEEVYNNMLSFMELDPLYTLEDSDEEAQSDYQEVLIQSDYQEVLIQSENKFESKDDIFPGSER